MPRTSHKAKSASTARGRAVRAAKKSAAETRAQKGDGDAAMPRGLWSGTLSFGLVTIPVQLYSATRSTRRSLRMLSPEGTPLARRYFNEQGKALEGDDLARGYQTEEGEFVLIEDDELERLLPDQSRDIDLSRFVPVDTIPPLYFERAYVLAPGESGTSAYRLLADTMERLGKAGIATFVMRERQYVVAITAQEGVLWAETMRFQDELRDKESLGLRPREPSSDALREMRSALASLNRTRIKERTLDDSYWQRVEKLVAKKKAQGEDVVSASSESEPDESSAEVIDLMEVLKRSLTKAKTRAS